MKLLFLTMCSFLLFTTGAMAQGTITVSGTVSDNNGIPVPGANVIEKGTTNGVVTNFDGEYTIEVDDNAVLVFSFVGFETQEIPVEGQSSINVNFGVGEGLDEVVVVGYGEQSRETITTSVSKLDADVLENVPFTNAATALQGTIAGVRVQTTSGQPGAEPRVIVRGGTSINDPNGATPLYVVDNVIREDLVGINPADIESMQVLKDAASTAIYGARGSNGVVIVTTKSGTAGKTVINYRGNIGFSELREKYDVLGARDHIYYGRLGIAATSEKHPERLPTLGAALGFGTGNDLTVNTDFTTQYLTDENRHKLDEGWESMPDPLDPSKTIIFQGTDWQDVMYRTALTQDHYLNFSGGSEDATFNIGVGLMDAEGIAITTEFNRFTTNINGKLKINDKMSVFGGANFSNSSDNQVYDEAGAFFRIVGLSPTLKYAHEDGTLNAGTGPGLGNPLFHLNNQDFENSANVLTINGGFNWELLPGLFLEPTASLLYKVNESTSFERSYLVRGNLRDERPSTASNSKWTQKQLDATLNYDRSEGDHNFRTLLGFSYFDREIYDLSAAGRGAATDLIPTLNASAEPTNVYSFISQRRLIGYFGRISYDYDKRYLVTINGRYDGASNLGRENKWGFFPGISAGWNMHQEDFWNEPAQISTLKLRASYGVNGNLGNISDFQAQGEYSVGNRYDGVSAVEYTGLANRELRWEQSKTLDFGFDLGLFDDRISLLFDVYRRVTDDLLTNLAMPLSTGFSSTITNLGSLENKGIELELGADIVRTDDFSWNISFNTAQNKNKILQLPENDNENNRIGGIFVYDPAIDDYAWRGGLQEGEAMGDVWGYQQLGVYATDEAAAAGPVDQIVVGPDKTKFGGDVNWLDVDDNDIIDTRDQVKMGNIFPEWTGGFSSTAEYKGLSLYVRLDYTTGHLITNYMRAALTNNFVGNTNMTTALFDSWLEQGDITDQPRYYWADQIAQRNMWRTRSGDNSASSEMYEAGDYLSIREVSLQYRFPVSWSESIGMDNVKFSVTGNNLKYFTDYQGQNPEEGGFDYGRYPIPRTVIFGINASF